MEIMLPLPTRLARTSISVKIEKRKFMKIIKVHFECFSQAKKLLRMFSERKNKIMEKRGITLVRIFFSVCANIFSLSTLRRDVHNGCEKGKKKQLDGFPCFVVLFNTFHRKSQLFQLFLHNVASLMPHYVRRENFLLLETTRGHKEKRRSG